VDVSYQLIITYLMTTKRSIIQTKTMATQRGSGGLVDFNHDNVCSHTVT